MDNDGFTIVCRKRRIKPKKNRVLYSRKYIIENIRNIMLEYKPYAVYLYGSVSRNEHTINSDIDIMVIWKKIPNNEKLDAIHYRLYTFFDKKIDFVNYRCKNDRVIIEPSTSDFIQNLLQDMICIIKPINSIYFDYY